MAYCMCGLAEDVHPTPECPGFPDASDTEPTTIADIVKAFVALPTGNLDGVFELIKATAPPTDPIDQRLVREKLIDVLKEKGVHSPAATLDAWIKQAPEADAVGQGTIFTFARSSRGRNPSTGPN